MHREERVGRDRYSFSVGGGGGCGLREPSFYSSLIDFKLCDFIRYPSLSLAQNPLKWHPTAFIVKAEIFSKTQECLHEPPSSFPSDSILTPSAPAVLSWCCFKLTNMLLPQDLCTGGVFFLEYFLPRHLHDLFLYFIQVSLEMTLCQISLIREPLVLPQHHQLL